MADTSEHVDDSTTEKTDDSWWDTVWNMKDVVPDCWPHPDLGFPTTYHPYPFLNRDADGHLVGL
jgi:hypothetical protein